MQFDRDGRYATAGEFADDLRTWLRGEPSFAHPNRLLRRPWCWAGRNKILASAFAASVALAVGIIVLAFAALNARAANAETRADAARESEKAQKRESAIVQAQKILDITRSIGWSRDALGLLGDAAAIRRDEALRNQFALTLSGVDAKQRKRFTTFGAQSLLFDPKGQRLLMGTTAGAKVWDYKDDRLKDFNSGGDGPVAFRPDGTPLQLVVRAKQRGMALVDLQHKRDVATLQFSKEADLRRDPVTAITPDGSLVAACVTQETDEGPLMV
jgi:hypothetical protein